MADHLTEEEQVEALKRWWNENWLHVVAPIFVVLIGYIGWNTWKDHQADQVSAASQLYQDLSQAAEVAPGASFTGDQKEAITDLAEKLVGEHGGTMYADMANLILARLQVEDNQLDAAAGLLQAVKDQGANESMRQLATARLARVLSTKGEADKALALVASTPSEPYRALYEEIRGDIYLKKGEQEAAHTAYSAALLSLPAEEYVRRNLIEMKLSTVAVSAAAPETAVEASTEPEPEVASDVEGDA
ncbi:Putative negative regulator of RcsB-dependent stress response [Alteromonadaceae bacterium Bs31]|nr:Putative negative regulator of RcsB-dependent stress response [Alteromonadaceae bacterium Bs31]